MPDLCAAQFSAEQTEQAKNYGLVQAPIADTVFKRGDKVMLALIEAAADPPQVGE